MNKRLTAILLAVCMIFTLLPLYAFAEENATVPAAESTDTSVEPAKNLFANKLKGTAVYTLQSVSETDNIPTIEADTETPAEITTAGESAYFRYTPEYTESYTFVALGTYDTYGYLYDSDMNVISSDDDDGQDYNFSITYTLEAGQTYFMAAGYYGSSACTFNVTLKTNHESTGKVITPASCTADGLMDCTCSVCGKTYTEIIPATGHDYDDGTVLTPYTCDEDGVMEYACTVCGDTYTDPIPAAHRYNEERVCESCGWEWHMEGTCGENITWLLDKTGTLTISGSGAIPDYSYSSGSPWSEYADEIITVKITSGITSIGAYAFFGCSNITSVSMSDSITMIGKSAFCDCDGLTNIVIPGTVSTIGESAFDSCDALESIVLSDGLTFIGKYAFYACPITEIIIPDSVTTIENSVFSNCQSLVSVELSDNVSRIADYTFNYCRSLTNVTIPDSVTAIGYSAFYECTSLANITIPDSVTSIEENAFRYCSALTSITIPQGVTSLEENVFASCESLTDVKIGNGVTEIGDSAFFRCGLVNFDIPNSVSSIGIAAFSECESLTSITIPDSVTNLGARAFSYCSGLTNVKIGKGITAIEDGTFSSCSRITQIEIPEGITYIGEDAFFGCSELAYITIPTTVTSIGNTAFYDSTDSTSQAECPISIHFYGNAPTMGDDMFGNAVVAAFYPKDNTTWTESIMQDYGGTVTWLPEASTDDFVASGTSGDGLDWKFASDGTLTISGTGDMWDYSWDDMPWSIYRGGIFKLVIEEGVTSIGGDAFIHCVNLSSMSLPDGLTEIGNRSFMFCRNLETVAIPKSVTAIDSAAFSYCSSIERFVVDKENTKFSNDEEGVMFNKDMTKIVAVPNAITGHYVIPESVATIPYGAFQYCDNLNEVTIPASVTNIENYAFGWCYGLKNVYFMGDTPTMASSIFRNDSVTVYYPAGNETWTSDVMQDYAGYVTWVPAYAVIEEGTKTEVEQGEEAKIHIEADHTTFKAVYVDDKLVNASNYTVIEGSTIITFTTEYLATLSNGDHPVTVEFQDGVAHAVLSISAPAFMSGDLNLDGTVDSDDLTMLARHVGGIEAVEDQALLNADVTGDGKVNSDDLTKHARYVGGIITDWEQE